MLYIQQQDQITTVSGAIEPLRYPHNFLLMHHFCYIPLQTKINHKGRFGFLSHKDNRHQINFLGVISSSSSPLLSPSSSPSPRISSQQQHCGGEIITTMRFCALTSLLNVHLIFWMLHQQDCTNGLWTPSSFMSWLSIPHPFSLWLPKQQAPVAAQCQLTQIEVVYQSRGAFAARMV